MRVDLFDFVLPPEQIALRPAAPRDSARMLVVDGGVLDDRRIGDLPTFLRPGDALVVNDTQVIPARLVGVRARGATFARIEATLIKRERDNIWRALVKPAKRLAPGDRVRFGAAQDSMTCLMNVLDATVAARREGEATLAFDLSGAALDEALARIGHVPLPPYIAARRPDDAADAHDYQTMFAAAPGAVAAPTAGLHFTPALVAAIAARGVTVHHVTLHVGAGTFSPVKTDDTADHVMHEEWASLSSATAAALNAARAQGGRVIAVGTTALRVLESAADASGRIRPFSGETAIFITPGYAFRAVDALLTNFHLPRSTLFMLVAAFSGLATMQTAYAHAIAAGYRFYSYGDACLLVRTPAER